MNDYDKERREWYLSHGICPHCGQNDLQRGYKLCLQCRMNDNELKSSYYEQAVKNCKSVTAVEQLSLW